MEENVLQLYPASGREMPLKGLYLGEDLRAQSDDLGRAFVYTNFITSLDGRIAIPHPSGSGMTVPKQTANERDWRLFQELAVQADVLITSGRYLRDYVEGRAQEILRVYEDPSFSDLREWREQQDMPAFPDLAVVSGSLKFPLPDLLTWGDRSVVVITTENADPERLKTMRESVTDVIIAGEKRVEGKPLVEGLAKLGYKTIYNTTGPKVMHLLLKDSVLNRLYLTLAQRLLGGSPYSSIVEGELLQPAKDFHLRSLYLDPHALDGAGQLLTTYERA
jgi:riboflavin biosynthesis pyrimidine reductase